MNLNRRAFLALPFVAPIAALFAKAPAATILAQRAMLEGRLQRPFPDHLCWECKAWVYGMIGNARNWRGEIRHLSDGLPGDHVLCRRCADKALDLQWERAGLTGRRN